MIDWNCGPESTFDAWRNSSSVRMVEMERLICAGSGILNIGILRFDGCWLGSESL